MNQHYCPIHGEMEDCQNAYRENGIYCSAKFVHFCSNPPDGYSYVEFKVKEND